jgi:fructose-1-phosphate kinase PfkB-like protein
MRRPRTRPTGPGRSPPPPPCTSAREGRIEARGAYPVGSGDAFLAGLVVALDDGAGWPEALRSALGAGAANAEQPGAGSLDRPRAAELAEQAHVESV